jgi:hypothetical protein
MRQGGRSEQHYRSTGKKDEFSTHDIAPREALLGPAFPDLKQVTTLRRRQEVRDCVYRHVAGARGTVVQRRRYIWYLVCLQK